MKNNIIESFSKNINKNEIKKIGKDVCGLITIKLLIDGVNQLTNNVMANKYNVTISFKDGTLSVHNPRYQKENIDYIDAASIS